MHAFGFDICVRLSLRVRAAYEIFRPEFTVANMVNVPLRNSHTRMPSHKKSAKESRTAPAPSSDGRPHCPDLRLVGAAHVTVLNPHGTSVAASAVPADTLLYTRVLERLQSVSAPFSARLCRHFERHGACDRGENCRFIHRASATSPPSPASRCAAKITPAATDDLEASQRPSLAPPGDTAAATVARNRAGGKAHTASLWRVPRDAAAAMPESSRIGLARIKTSRGWRHAAYDALVLRS